MKSTRMGILLIASLVGLPHASPAMGAEAPFPSEQSVKLVADGGTPWRIGLSQSAGPVERFAAAELRRYVEQMTGARLEFTGSDPGEHVVQLGLRSLLQTTGGLPSAKPGYDGYAIVVAKRSIVVAGDNPRGLLYGVYDLLERLGCRWYHPSLDPRDPELVPCSPDLSLPVDSWSEASPIEFRVYNGSALFFEIVPDRLLPQIDWAAKNRYNAVSWQAHHGPGRVAAEIEQMAACGALDAMDKRGLMLHGPGHCFPFFLSSEKYFDEHPEWFGLHDGKRFKHGGEWPMMNYCWSNPEANAEFIRSVEAFVKKWPQIRILYMVGIDGGNVCGCERCQARGGPDLIVDLFNRLADHLAATAPNVILETVIGYGPLEQPPEDAVPNGKWRGLYAHWGRNHGQSYGDPDYTKRANMETWISRFDRQTICSYYAAASHQPFNAPPFLHALEGDMKYLVNHGVSGHLTLQYPHGFWWNFSFNLAAAGRYAYYYPARGPREQLRRLRAGVFRGRSGPARVRLPRSIGRE